MRGGQSSFKVLVSKTKSSPIAGLSETGVSWPNFNFVHFCGLLIRYELYKQYNTINECKMN